MTPETLAISLAARSAPYVGIVVVAGVPRIAGVAERLVPVRETRG